VTLRLTPGDGAQARLDLMWQGQAMSTETVMAWEMDAMSTGTETSSLTVRDVVQRHGGEFWFERDRPRHRAFFRFLLPLAPAAAAAAAGASPAAAALVLRAWRQPARVLRLRPVRTGRELARAGR
jgi:DNA polymerase-3 subunit epsilon